MYYVYLLKSPKNNKVFYVGKGKGNRMKRHSQLAKQDKISNNNIFLFRKIKNILKEYDDVKYEIVFETDDERTAYEKEQEIIERFGIQNLCNMTSGLYSIKDDYIKDAISKTMRYKYLHDQEFMEKMEKIFEERKSVEYRESMSKSVKNSERHKSIYTEEFRNNISESIKRWWTSLTEEEFNEYRKNMSESLKKSKPHRDRLNSEEYRKNLSDGLKNSESFKKYNENRKGKSRGKYRETEKNIKRRIRSILIDENENIIKEFSGLKEVCEYFDIKTSTACIWLKEDKKIKNLILRKL